MENEAKSGTLLKVQRAKFISLEKWRTIDKSRFSRSALRVGDLGTNAFRCPFPTLVKTTEWIWAGNVFRNDKWNLFLSRKEAETRCLSSRRLKNRVGAKQALDVDSHPRTFLEISLWKNSDLSLNTGLIRRTVLLTYTKNYPEFNRQNFRVFWQFRKLSERCRTSNTLRKLNFVSDKIAEIEFTIYQARLLIDILNFSDAVHLTSLHPDVLFE